MLEALWSVEFFSSDMMFGAGVVVLETDRILGGDAQYYYVGDYGVLPTGEVRGQVEITHYAGQPLSVFGPRTNFKIQFAGQPQERVMELTGHLVDDPNRTIQVKLTRRAELP